MFRGLVMARAAIGIAGMIEASGNPATGVMAARTLTCVVIRQAMAGLAVVQAAVVHNEVIPILGIRMAANALASIMVDRGVKFVAGSTFSHTLMFIGGFFPGADVVMA